MKPVQLLCTITVLGSPALFEATPAAGQTAAWLAWHGCWQAEGAPAGEYLCIVPDGAAGVRMVSVAGGLVVAESRVVTDGRARRVQTEGCDGSEVAFWSADYQRVFLRSELSCEAGVKRLASGVFAITGVDGWVSVQAVTIDDRTATRTVRYTVAADVVAPAAIRSALDRSELDRIGARNVALAAVDAADVDEAVRRVDAAAVQEWLLATDQPLQLADQLAPAAEGAVTRSALDHAGLYADDRGYDPQQPVREVVHVVERPVEVVQVVEQPIYVTHTHVHDYRDRYRDRRYRYRACWDPFFSGVVLGLGYGASIGLGNAHCGRIYRTYFSPWGYDLYGWRFAHARPIIVAGRPIIHYREPVRPPRLIYTTRGDDRSRATTARVPTPPRERSATPTRYAQPRTPTGAAPTRYAQPRTPADRSPRALPPTRASQPVRTAKPAPGTSASRPPSATRDRSRPVFESTARSAVPRATVPSRTPPAVRDRSVTRAAPPLTSSAPRERATSRGTATPRAAPRTSSRPAASAPARAPSSRPAAAPLRSAKPRGGN